jgi:hypothetical protein
MKALTLNMMQFEARKTSLAARIARFIRAFTKSCSDWIIVRVERGLARDTTLIEQQIALIPEMDDEQVNVGLIFIKNMLPVLAKMDRTIGKFDNPGLAIVFKEYKKAVYQFESRLHLKHTAHLPVTPTDESLREALYNASISSVTSKL